MAARNRSRTHFERFSVFPDEEKDTKYRLNLDQFTNTSEIRVFKSSMVREGGAGNIVDAPSLRKGVLQIV